MDKKSTPDNVLRYIYKETSFSENIALRQEISENWQLQEQYIELRNTAKTLEKLPLRSPSESSINIILGYSQHANRELEHLL